MLLKLTDYGRDKTHLGFERITIIKNGFDSNGEWQSVICRGSLDGNHPVDQILFNVSGDDLHLDLLMHYKIV